MSDENNPVAAAMSTLSATLKVDQGYLWSWFCNLKMSGVDAGCSRTAAAHAADNFLKIAFDVDITEHPFWKDDPASKTPVVSSQAAGTSPTTAEALAVQFHEIYETLAPEFGYETRENTREFDPDSNNGRLMIAVCEKILESDNAASIGQSASQCSGMTLKVARSRAPYEPYLTDRADGVKGHYAIARWHPSGYREVWNTKLNDWSAFCSEVLSHEEALATLKRIKLTAA